MEVFVNNERRELKVTDVLTGKDYATALICSDQVVDTDEYNRFVMTETEYNRWKNLLTVLQESEDLRPNLIQAVGKEKLDNYIFEERHRPHARKAPHGRLGDRGHHFFLPQAFSYL